MNFSDHYILENEYVRLRSLELSDYELLLPFSLNEPEIWCFNYLGAAGEDNLLKYIAHAIEQREKGNEYPFIVYDKTKGAYAGSTRFYSINGIFKYLEIGYTWYGKEFQGTGLNKHCKYLMLEFAFDQLNMERVAFKANNANERSKQAMLSIGCIEEGIMRSASLDAAGERIDVIMLSIIKSDWYRRVKNELALKLKNI